MAFSHYLVPHPEPEVLLANLRSFAGLSRPRRDPRDRLSHQSGEENTMPQEPDAPAEAGFEVTRFIPVPNSVSEPAQQFLALGFSMGGDIAPQPSDRTRRRRLARHDQGDRRSVDRRDQHAPGRARVDRREDVGR